MNVGTTPVICKTCRGVLLRGQHGGWGHAVNPTFRHHYPRPVYASTLTEAEKAGTAA